jgi:hypothetical protein
VGNFTGRDTDSPRCIRIGDSPDEFERMLAVLRFSFSKELKFVRARLGKPYNSALGGFLTLGAWLDLSGEVFKRSHPSQGNTSAVPGDFPQSSSIEKRKSLSSGHISTCRYLGHRRTVVKEVADGRHRCCGHRTAGGRAVIPGEPRSTCSEDD